MKIKNVVKGLQEQFPLYADNFPIWSEQGHGIALYATWLALAEKEYRHERATL